MSILSSTARADGGAGPPCVIAGRRHAEHVGYRGDRKFSLIRAHEFEDPDGTAPVAALQRCVFADWLRSGDRWFNRGNSVDSPLFVQLGDSYQQLTAMADAGDAEFFEIVGSQMAQ